MHHRNPFWQEVIISSTILLATRKNSVNYIVDGGSCIRCRPTTYDWTSSCKQPPMGEACRYHWLVEDQVYLILWWWCHDRTSSTDLASQQQDSTFFEEHRTCFVSICLSTSRLAFLCALISKDATVASAYTTVQEHVVHLTRHNPSRCDQLEEAVLYVHSAEKGTSEVFVSLQPRAHGGLLSKGVHTSGGKL